MLWARLNRGGLCGGVSWRRPVTTVTVTVTAFTSVKTASSSLSVTHTQAPAELISLRRLPSGSPVDLAALGKGMLSCLAAADAHALGFSNRFSSSSRAQHGRA